MSAKAKHTALASVSVPNTLKTLREMQRGHTLPLTHSVLPEGSLDLKKGSSPQ